MKVNEGTCPHCGSENIDYGAIELVEGMAYYPIDCNDCFKDGREWYDLVYSNTEKIKGE